MAVDNPTNSTLIQAFIELEKRGYLSDPQNKALLRRVQKDIALQRDIDQKLQQPYRADKVKYVQLTICQQLLELSPLAMKVLVFMGMYSTQDGLISIKNDTFLKIMDVNRRTLYKALQELEDFGCIIKRDGSKRHEPAIWQVNPELLYSGKSSRQAAAAAEFKRICNSNMYTLASDLVIQQDRVYRDLNGTKVYYFAIDLISAATEATKRKPSGTATAPEGSNNQKHNSMIDTNCKYSDHLPGQITLDDIDNAFATGGDSCE